MMEMQYDNNNRKLEVHWSYIALKSRSGKGSQNVGLRDTSRRDPRD